MSPKGQVYLFAALFALLGLALTTYKALVLHFPLLPDASRKVWNIEAKITYTANGGPVTANMALPEAQQAYTILDETFASSGYGFAIQDGLAQRRAEWTRREASGVQTLYYQLEVIADPAAQPVPAQVSAPVDMPPPVWTSSALTAAEALIAEATALSSEPASFTQQLLQMLNAPNLSQDAALLVNRDTTRAQLAVNLLRQAEIPARLIRGIYLEDRLYNQRAQEIIEIHDGEEWIIFDPRTATRGLPANFFMWQRGGQSLLDLIGGYNSTVHFSVLGNNISAKALALQEAEGQAVALVDFNIYSLPIDKQTIFKSLLLVPIGALVVVIFRVLIGVKTSGTFMPVLIALAFIQTQLLPGLAILISLVVVGLWIRSYLSRLDLLMVARLGAVLITVVILMAGFSILSFKLGLDQVLTVTFFPMIIIAWTIERMSILWEEEGPREVLTQGGGSLVVAVIAYLMMTNDFIEHLTYNFPETMLIVFGLILVLGQYTGYRLTELKRFRFLIEK